tara:strand:+ start:193 stop:438 length:246 start_codon:yes stop_codon:yes gene_type:complete
MSEKLNEIVEHCGYGSAFALLRDNMTPDDLLDLLESYIHNYPTEIEDDVEEIATDKYEWFDYERAKADAEEEAYQRYRDGD